MAIKTLKEQYGIDASGHMPSDVKYVSLSKYDLIVALEEDVPKVLDIPEHVSFELWTVADPYGRPDEYIACGRLIEKRLNDLGRRLNLG